jgi:DNA-binding CsgD family transcriptional regulator
MERSAAAPIDVCEAAYDLRVGPDEWLPNLLEKGAPLFDRGLGCAAAVWAGRSDDAEPLLAQLCVSDGADDLGAKFARAAQEVGSALQHTSAARDEGAHTASETLREPSILRAFEKRVGCEDVLGVWALDPRVHGVGINIPSPEVISLRRSERIRWQKLAKHIATGHRLRRRFGCVGESGGTPISDLPFDGDALIDPARFVVKHAKGDATKKEALEMLREAAMQVDQARSTLRNEDPVRALEVWEGLVHGRWSLVDWFDSDGRRFVVAVPNAPGAEDSRGLTKREREVVERAARGETSKIISCHLGVSRQRISMLLTSAMRKLGVKTQAELVVKMSAFGKTSESVK